MDRLDDLKILCVEDDEFALLEMVSFLKKRAGKVFYALNGEDGIRQYEIHRPDIVVADLLMPGIDGMEMLQRLRKFDPEMHAIVVTSVRSLDTVLESIDLGIDNYILKPVEFTELEQKLKKVAERIHFKRKNTIGTLDFIDDKRILEDSVKKEFIKALKNYMGKGPKEIVVQFISNEINIVVMEALTVMESNMVKELKNHEAIKQFRNIAYESVCKSFESYLTDLLGIAVKFNRVEIDLKKRVDKIKFII